MNVKLLTVFVVIFGLFIMVLCCGCVKSDWDYSQDEFIQKEWDEQNPGVEAIFSKEIVYLCEVPESFTIVKTNETEYLARYYEYYQQYYYMHERYVEFLPIETCTICGMKFYLGFADMNFESCPRCYKCSAWDIGSLKLAFRPYEGDPILNLPIRTEKVIIEHKWQRYEHWVLNCYSDHEGNQYVIRQMGYFAYGGDNPGWRYGQIETGREYEIQYVELPESHIRLSLVEKCLMVSPFVSTRSPGPGYFIHRDIPLVLTNKYENSNVTIEYYILSGGAENYKLKGDICEVAMFSESEFENYSCTLYDVNEKILEREILKALYHLPYGARIVIDSKSQNLLDIKIHETDLIIVTLHDVTGQIRELRTYEYSYPK